MVDINNTISCLNGGTMDASLIKAKEKVSLFHSIFTLTVGVTVENGHINFVRVEAIMSGCMFV